MQKAWLSSLHTTPFQWYDLQGDSQASLLPALRTVGCDAKKCLSRDRVGARRCIPCRVAGLRSDSVELMPLPFGRGAQCVGRSAWVKQLDFTGLGRRLLP